MILGTRTGPAGELPSSTTTSNRDSSDEESHFANPALYGDNQAIFSVELDEEGVQLIENSLMHGELMPIGVVYSLDFLALRPAFSVELSRRLGARPDALQRDLLGRHSLLVDRNRHRRRQADRETRS